MQETAQLGVWESEGGALVPPLAAPGAPGATAAGSAPSPQRARPSLSR
jgi:hypothetical protein